MYEGLELISSALCIVGESPLWDVGAHTLYYLDIQGKRLRSVSWSDGAVSDTVLPFQCGFIVPTVSGALVAGGEDGLYRLTGDKPVRVDRGFEKHGERFNDGKAGPDGRLYAGTFSRDRSAAFYRAESDGSVTLLFDGVGNSNGLDWDTEKNVMYYNDTPTKRTDAFDFDPESGELSRRRTVCEYPAGNPDGMTVDAEGYLWTALWGAGEVVRVEPASERIVRRIKLPVSQAACCVFAGDALDELVITTAAHGINLRDEPLAGSTFKIRAGVSGRAPFRYDIKL